MDVSETKQNAPETCIHKVLLDFVTLSQEGIKEITIYNLAVLKKRSFPAKNLMHFCLTNLEFKSCFSFQVPNSDLLQKF